MPNEWYKHWFGSTYYRILYANRDELEAQAFVEKLINYLQPLPGSKMLDIACGDGRYTVQLAEKGFDATGIDISVESIQRALKHEDEHTHFFIHDMRFPFYINYYDYAFNFFTSFGYFNRHRYHEMAAKAFGCALKPGGILVLDYLNKDYVINSLVPEETIERGNTDFHIKRSVNNNYIEKEIDFKDEEGKPRHYEECVAAFGLKDFMAMFRKAGLSLVSTFGDYNLNEFSVFSSPRLIMIFKK